MTADEELTALAELEKRLEAIKVRSLVSASLAENALGTLVRLRAEQTREAARSAELEVENAALRDTLREMTDYTEPAMSAVNGPLYRRAHALLDPSANDEH